MNRGFDMRISRRNFIKAGAAGTAGLSLSGPAVSRKWFKTAAAKDSDPSEVLKYTYHTPNCGGRCAFICHVRDGKLSLIEPNTWADPKFSTICLGGIGKLKRVNSLNAIRLRSNGVGKGAKVKLKLIRGAKELQTMEV